MNDSENKNSEENLEFFIDADGSACARGEDERLAVYLQTDLQGSESATQELLALLSDPAHRGDFTGNAHCVEIRENTVRIEALFDDEAADRCLSREEMTSALRNWLAFISRM